MFERITGKHVLLVMLVFFGITFVVNALLVTSALRSFSGEVASRSYVHGLRYNDTLAARAAQRAAGWHATVDAHRAVDGTVFVALAVSDRNARPVERLVLEGILRLPATERADRKLVFAETRPGRYEARVSDLAPAYWDLAITGQAADSTAIFESRNRLWIP